MENSHKSNQTDSGSNKSPQAPLSPSSPSAPMVTQDKVQTLRQPLPNTPAIREIQAEGLVHTDRTVLCAE